MIKRDAGIYRNHAKAEVILDIRVIRPLSYTEFEHCGSLLVPSLS
jgi:hypothetical protein